MTREEYEAMVKKEFGDERYSSNDFIEINQKQKGN